MQFFCGPQIKNIFLRRKHYIYFFCRFINKLNEKKTFKNKDPFKRKTHVPFSPESDSRNSTRICITIFGNAGLGQPRCIGLFTEFKGYLFNCGENVGRYCKEYAVNTCLVKHVFITQRKWENISGLSDIYVANQVSGIYHMFLYGPPGVENFLSLLSSKVFDTQLVKKEEGYIDHTVKIEPIAISSEKKVFSSYNNKRHFEAAEPGIVYSYVCKIHEKPGEFSAEKCIEKGVPLGPDLLKLKNWEDIILPSGDTVFAKDVHDKSYPERVLLIVDCPSESFLKPFVLEEKFRKFQSPHVSTPIFVFHFTASHIFKTREYQSWMNRFHESTQHLILNSDNPNLGSNVVHQIEKYFNLLHPKIFRKLRENELVPTQSCSTDSISGPKCIYLPPMMQIHLRPKEEFNWNNVVKDHDNINITVEGEDIVQQSLEFYEKLEELKSVLREKSHLNVSQSVYPEVVFLGTSSSAPTAYRNVTAILVNTNPNQSFLLDCGEGCWMQFVRYFGNDVYPALRKISCIFISHKHLDHYMGVFEMVSQRIKAFQMANMQYSPVAVILPFEIYNIFMKFCEIFENLYPAVRLFSCKTNLSNKKEALKKFIGNLELRTVPVKHCKDAWGIVLESLSDWKIVYSGDSAPCQSLVDAGKDCTLLIHEASIEDGMLSEALAKRHSTPSQVLDIAERMNAQHTILTHFSKRYKGFPVLPECNREMTCAFDFMTVRRCDLPLLPLFTPIIKCLFQEQLDTYGEKYSYRVDFENTFLKVLKSQ